MLLLYYFLLILINCQLSYNYLFYILEFPEDIESSWPPSNAELFPRTNKGNLDQTHEKLLNFGAGVEISAENGLYGSGDLFTLYTLIMSRLRVHKNRTLNRNLADLIIIPYDIETSSYYNKSNGHYRMHQMGGCKEEGPYVSNELKKSILYNNNKLYGYDHIIISEMGSAFYVECLDVLLTCLNCTKLATMPAFTNNYKNTNRKWYGIPFISAIHYNEDMKIYSWIAKFNKNLYNKELLLKYIIPQNNYSSTSLYQYDININKIIELTNLTIINNKINLITRINEIGEIYLNKNTNKLLLNNISYLVSAWFATIVQDRMATKIRHSLIVDCDNRPHLCKKVLIHRRQGLQCFSKYQKTNNTNINCLQTESGFDIYNNSIFCLMPPGDGIPRKGYFDAIAVGCIPVVFVDLLGYKAWEWWFPNETDYKVSVAINKAYVIYHLGNVIDILATIPIQEIYKKQLEIEKLVPSLLYSIPPKKYYPYIGYGGARSKLDTALGFQNGFQPPFKDAVDIILDKSYEKVQEFISNNYIIPLKEKPLTSNINSYEYWFGRIKI